MPEPGHHGRSVLLSGCVVGRVLARFCCRRGACVRDWLMVDELLERVMFPRKRRGVVRGLLAGSLQLTLPRAQGEPRLQVLAQRSIVPGGDGFHRLRRLVLDGLMLLKRALDLRTLIAALPCQVLLRVFE